MMALPAAFSFRRLRRLARRAGDVSFLEYVRAQPSQVSTFWTQAVTDVPPKDSYTNVAWNHYAAWCAKNGKTPEPRPGSAKIADGGLGW